MRVNEFMDRNQMPTEEMITKLAPGRQQSRSVGEAGDTVSDSSIRQTQRSSGCRDFEPLEQYNPLYRNRLSVESQFMEQPMQGTASTPGQVDPNQRIMFRTMMQQGRQTASRTQVKKSNIFSSLDSYDVFVEGQH